MKKKFNIGDRVRFTRDYDTECVCVDKGDCGTIERIDNKDMQVDRIHAQYLGGKDDIENLMPACRMCNYRKGTLSVEQFRQIIKNQADYVFRTFAARMSRFYGLIERVDKPIVFYFERSAGKEDEGRTQTN